MTTYIKLSTNEYPRHDGDIAIDPVGLPDYAVVQWTDRPAFNAETQLCVQGSPIQENNVWKMTWEIQDATQEQLDIINKFKIPPI